MAVEDEITSTVLGPLELLPAADVLKVICALLRAAGINTAEDRCQDDVELAFWPRRKVADLQRAVEPDCYVTFRWR